MPVMKLLNVPALQATFGVAMPPQIPPSSWVDALVLAANVAQSYTIPVDTAGKRAVLLRLTGSLNKAQSATDLYFNCYGTAAAPTVNVLNGTASTEMIGPEAWVAVDTDVTAISFLSTAAGSITIEAWAAQ
jgi:hypothetical protein